MQLLELSLYNFCLYRGEQTFNLSPDRRNGKAKPIILVGGINGGGKTSFFDSILLVLYGSRANCSKRSNQSYSEFLTDCIHRGVDPADGASISLTFQYVSEGVERIYEVRRRWNVKKTLREHLEVYCDGKKHADFSKNWNHVVEEIVPIGISQLFFFDAEKIRFIADDESTSEALGSAIKSLLGLDLAERLIADMKVVHMKLAERQISNSDREAVDEWKGALDVICSELKARKQDCGAARNRVDFAAKELVKAEEAFARIGGKHWDERNTNEVTKKELTLKKTGIESNLTGLASGSLPLAMISDLLKTVDEFDKESRSYQQLIHAGEALDSHDKAILSELRDQQFSAKVLESIELVLAKRRQLRAEIKEPEPSIHLSEGSRNSLSLLMTKELARLKKEGASLVFNLEQTSAELDLIRRQLASTPKETEIKDVAEKLKAAVRSHADAESELKRFEQACEEKIREREEVESKIEEKLLRTNAEQVAADDAERMSHLSERTRETMKVFLEQSTAAKIDRLAANILEAFQYLLRKKSLVESISIDPVDFSITLIDSDGMTIPKQRLSEGEKQMFAISVLWGLGRASNRRLPAIIDTPMARLDAMHRGNLLTRYFPSASHQTIILSTDTEVDEEFYAALEPNVARAYHLNYDEKTKQTIVEQGYFWHHEEAEAV
ncbi:DNA sulfur modification protein DndD [Novipirellula caenicola]|uniref:Rad50/SbcC-type AAA domain-containing protein n=1 Tax=Novipirellula caenicola TaxID=1536901 RepID=A0ABP9VWC0_9BACT